METPETTAEPPFHPPSSAEQPSTQFPVQPRSTQFQYSILPALTPSDLDAITHLFTQYTQSLNIDLTFQDLATELSTLPGKYSPSQGGMLLLARNTSTNEAVGCIALRSLPLSLPSSTLPPSSSNSMDSRNERKTCELKRLYVHPSTRGAGLGKKLTQLMLVEAERIGYEEVKLDTLPTMVSAQRMYEKLGFRDVEAYCYNPIEGTRFLGLKLGRREEGGGRRL